MDIATILRAWSAGTPFVRALERSRRTVQIARCAVAAPQELGSLVEDFEAIDLVGRLCSENGTVIDIGGHVGLVSGLVKRDRPDVRCLVLEPIAEKAALIRHFLNVEVRAVAAGDIAGTADFFVHRESSALSSLHASETGASEDQLERRQVLVSRVDDEVALDRKIDVIKIDAEGAELAVLRGAERVLQESRPAIVFESACPERGAKIFAHLVERGYQVYAPSDALARRAPMNLESFLAAHTYPRRALNFVARTRDRARQGSGTFPKEVTAIKAVG